MKTKTKILLTCLLGSVFLSHVSAQPAAQGVPYQNGRVVAAEREGEGPSQIFTFAPDGSDRKQLTSSGANYQPGWSRDGKRILFSSNHEIWVMNADGGEKRQLTFNTPGGNFTPVESPDGKRIAFSGVRGHTPPEVYVRAGGAGVLLLRRRRVSRPQESLMP